MEGNGKVMEGRSRRRVCREHRRMFNRCYSVQVVTIPLSVTSTTLASFDPAGIKKLKLPVKKSAAAYTGQPSMPGPATLPKTCKLAERLSVPVNGENLKALEALREHRKFIEKSRAYADAVAAERPPSPPSNTSGIVEIPDHIDHIPPTKIGRAHV